MRFTAIVLAALSAGTAHAQSPAASPPATPPGFTAPPRADAPAVPATAQPGGHTAATAQKTGRTGRDIYVGGYITVDATCKVGKQPTVEITQPPQNGTTRTRRDAYNLRNAPNVPRSKCLGVSPEGIAVMYVSKPRFKGEDRFSYTVTFGDGRTRSVDATITVQ